MKDDTLDVLADVINQACRCGAKNHLDSCALSAYAWGMQHLAEHGKITITHHVGRRVIGYWNDEPVKDGRVKMIKEGDIVDVYFMGSNLEPNVKVLRIPCATGNSWVVERGDGTIVYVQLFEKIVKLEDEGGDQ